MPTLKEIEKDSSMKLQKKMIDGYYLSLKNAKENNKKIVYSFVPGNIIELINSFDLLTILPEIDALRAAMRNKSGFFINKAENNGLPEDVCGYLKTQIGIFESDLNNNKNQIPKPDLLLLSYTGCFTFIKWFEILKQRFNCPVVMLHIPYQIEGENNKNAIDYIIKQLNKNVIPELEKLSGKKYDQIKFKNHLKLSKKAEDDFVWTLKSAKNIPSPIDAFFNASYYIAPIFTFFRGTKDAILYYQQLKNEISKRIEDKKGPVIPTGEIKKEKFRLVMEGPPDWSHFREFWKIFSDENAVIVASSYSKVGGIYDKGFRHDPENPLKSTAEYCYGCYTNLDLGQRVKTIVDYIKEYKADGFIINSPKNCSSFSSGQLVMLDEIEKISNKPGCFLETDLADPRYFSHSNIKARLDSFFQMINQQKIKK